MQDGKIGHDVNIPKIFVLRHGETTWNRVNRIQGHLDAPLTERGVAQAEAQGRILRDQVLPLPDLDIWVSPLGRTQTTWTGVQRVIGPRQSIATPELSEAHMGEWQGTLRKDILDQSPDLRALSLFELSLSSPGGEDFAALEARVRKGLSALVRPTICVTHGITSLMLRGLAQGFDRARMAQLPLDQGVIYAVENGQERILREPA